MGFEMRWRHDGCTTKSPESKGTGRVGWSPVRLKPTAGEVEGGRLQGNESFSSTTEGRDPAPIRGVEIMANLSLPMRHPNATVLRTAIADKNAKIP